MFLSKKSFCYSVIVGVGIVGFPFFFCSNSYASGEAPEYPEPERITLQYLFHRALFQGDFTIARDILDRTAVDILAVDEYGWTPLMRSVQSREGLTLTCRFLAEGADVNATDQSSGYSPLMIAAMYTNIPGVCLLLQHGADVTAIDYNGHSVLQRARIHSGDQPLLRILEEASASASE